jgi:hypothetical protein
VRRASRILCLLILAFLGGADVTASPVLADPPALVLVELFTSEGCSSCPPADAVLTRLAHDQPEPGVRIVTLSEHVDYWDRLGWRDPFSSATFTHRQREYSLAVSHGRVYTPQAVIDGSLDALGSDERSIRAGVRIAAARPHGALTITRSPSELVLEARALPPAEGAHLFVAWVEDRATSRVTTGENAGRELVHTSVVRALRDAGPIANGAPVHVSTDDAPSSAPHVVAFVQVPDHAVLALAELMPL